MSFALLFLYLMLSMFRMLIHPSSGACDLFVELFHGLYCSINLHERKFSDTSNDFRAMFREMCQLTYVVFCFIYDCSIRPQKIGLDHCVLDLWNKQTYRGVDKSLARPGRKQARQHVRDARDFNNIETRAVVKFSFMQGKAPKEIHAILSVIVNSDGMIYVSVLIVANITAHSETLLSKSNKLSIYYGD